MLMRAAPLTSRLLLVGLVLVITAILIDGSLRTPQPKPQKPEAEVLKVHVPEADVPLLRTPAFITAYDDLLLRSSSEGQGVLLLKLRKGEAVYRYDPHTQALTLVPVEHWHNAQGPVRDCRLPSGSSPLALSLGPKSGQLLIDYKRVATSAGTTILNFEKSPSGKYAAVFSATGVEKGYKFLGGVGIAGPHYHQVFSLPDAVPLGKPVRLPLETEKSGIELCWSSDDQYVVYSDLVFSCVAIVSVAQHP